MLKTSFSGTLSLLTFLASGAYCDQVSLINAGGSTVVTSSFSIDSTVKTPAGPLTIDCPIKSTHAGPTVTTYDCAGGSFNFLSNDGTRTLIASFTSGVGSYGCSGGGKGGHVSCDYGFKGSFTGKLTENGREEAIEGTTTQSSGSSLAGTTVYNSAYTPFYFTNSWQVVRVDDLQGTNRVAFGGVGSGKGRFYGPSGIALDSAGRIYTADTYNGRIVRIDNIEGKNWTSYGTWGSGRGHFSSPSGVFVDRAGKIYVADTNNYRIVRMDDLTGKNWISYGTKGSGVGQFSSIESVAVDANERIYIPDPGNHRLARIDDMSGKNWAALIESPLISGKVYRFKNPSFVTVDSQERIYVTDHTSVIRVNGMNGAGWTSLDVGTELLGISVDASGTVFTGGIAVKLIDSMAGFLTSTALGGHISGIASIPLPSPVPAAIRLSSTNLNFGKQNVGTASGSQELKITNFGGSPLDFSKIETSSEFIDRSGCGTALYGGSTCTVGVAFKPNKSGAATGLMTIDDTSQNAGKTQLIKLSGTGTEPAANLAPGVLDFPAQMLKTASAHQIISLVNSGTGTLYIQSIATIAPFSEANNCPTYLLPGAGCMINVAFKPSAAGSATGFLYLRDGSGMQGVTLRGIGTSTAPLLTVSPASLWFPLQEVETKSASQTVVLLNESKRAVSIASIAAAGDFVATTHCGPSLAAGARCSMSVVFEPKAAGTRSGALSLHLSSGTQKVGLTGSGTTGLQRGGLSISPGALNFPNYQVGDSASQSESVKNTQGLPVGIASIVLSGDKSFTEANNCGSVLAEGASCVIQITFAPTIANSFAGAITIRESSGATGKVALNGNASGSGN